MGWHSHPDQSHLGKQMIVYGAQMPLNGGITSRKLLNGVPLSSAPPGETSRYPHWAGFFVSRRFADTRLMASGLAELSAPMHSIMPHRATLFSSAACMLRHPILSDLNSLRSFDGMSIQLASFLERLRNEEAICRRSFRSTEPRGGNRAYLSILRRNSSSAKGCRECGRLRT